MKAKNILYIALGTALILSIPLIAMQFTSEVKWDLRDFMVIGALLFGTGLLYELISSRMKSTRSKAILAAAFVATVVIIWVELAVGVFD